MKYLSDTIVFSYSYDVLIAMVHELRDITKISEAPLDARYKISRLLGARCDVIVIKFCSNLSAIDFYIIILNTYYFINT